MHCRDTLVCTQTCINVNREFNNVLTILCWTTMKNIIWLEFLFTTRQMMALFEHSKNLAVWSNLQMRCLTPHISYKAAFTDCHLRKLRGIKEAECNLPVLSALPQRACLPRKGTGNLPLCVIMLPSSDRNLETTQALALLRKHRQYCAWSNKVLYNQDLRGSPSCCQDIQDYFS